MDLIKIDYIDGEAAKTVLDFAANRSCAKYFSHLTVGITAQAALGKDVRSGSAPLLNSTAYHFLGVSQTIYGGRIDPVDAEFERAVNGGYGFVVVLRAPGELPARTADRPGSVAHSSNVQVRITKSAHFHLNLLFKVPSCCFPELPNPFSARSGSYFQGNPRCPVYPACVPAHVPRHLQPLDRLFFRS